MKFIGITGGVGCGKSMVLRFLESEYKAKVIYADTVAAELCEPGGECLERIRALVPEVFPESVIGPDGAMVREEMSKAVFASKETLKALNDIIHPAVKAEVIRIAEEMRESGECSLLIIEAALLIEEGYDKVCDELWYVHAPEEVRRQRLREHRGYSDEKTSSVMASQLPEEVFFEKCPVVIENGGTKEECYGRIRTEVERLLGYEQ